MKLASKMFTLTALAIACSAASAQQSAPLTVTGNITPPACAASMTNNGEFAFNTIDATTLNASGTTTLPTNPTGTLNIACLGDVQMAWTIVDNRPGTSYSTTDTGYMGLGKSGDDKIGYYFLKMSKPVLDGNNVYVVYSTDGGTTWNNRERDGYMLRAGQIYTPSASPNNGLNSSQLTKGKLFTANMVAYTTIAPKSTLDTSSEIDLDGSATLNLTYL